MLLRSLTSGVHDVFSLPLNAYMEGGGVSGVFRGMGLGFTSLFNHVSEGTLVSVSGFSSSISRNLDLLTHRGRGGAGRRDEEVEDERGFLSSFGMSLLGTGSTLMGYVSQASRSLLLSSGLQVCILKRTFKSFQRMKSQHIFIVLTFASLYHTTLDESSPGDSYPEYRSPGLFYSQVEAHEI